MYKVGDTILYNGSGVCRVEEIMQRNFQDKVIDYYVLRPVTSQSAKVFVPMGSEELSTKMKKVLSEQEIRALIQTMPDGELIWVDNENQRKERFKNILKSGSRKDLISLIRTLYTRQKDLKENGKKLTATDDRFFKDAEKMLYEEFAYVLDIEEEDVLSFIFDQIGVSTIA